MSTERNAGRWFNQASPAEWVKALGIIVALVIAGVQLRQEVAQLRQEVTRFRQDAQDIRADLRAEVQLNRAVTRDIQKEIAEVQASQSGTKALVERIAVESRDE